MWRAPAGWDQLYPLRPSQYESESWALASTTASPVPEWALRSGALLSLCCICLCGAAPSQGHLANGGRGRTRTGPLSLPQALPQPPDVNRGSSPERHPQRSLAIAPQPSGKSSGSRRKGSSFAALGL